MASGFTYRRRVEFADTDAATLIHFTALMRYMEEAEHAFYRSLGESAFRRTEEGVAGMPRVSVSCDFLAPVRYGDEVEVRLILREKRRRVLRYDAEFRVDGPDGPIDVARGSMTVVYARRSHGSDTWAATEIPASLLDRLEAREADDS